MNEKIEWAKQTIPQLPLSEENKSQLLVKLNVLSQNPDEHFIAFLEQINLLNNWARVFEIESKIHELEENRQEYLDEQKSMIMDLLKEEKHKDEQSRLDAMRDVLQKS